MIRSLCLSLAFIVSVCFCSCKKQEAPTNPVAPAPTQPQQPQQPDNTPPAPPSKQPAPQAVGSIQPTKTFKVDLVDVLVFGLSRDGGTAGLAGRGKFKDGGELEHISAFYDLSSGKRVGVPIKLDGPGTISNGGKTAAYSDGSKVFVHDITMGQQTEAAQVSKPSGFFAYAPDGKLLVTAYKTKLTFRPWPSGEPLEVDAKTPVLALSRVFLQGTRVAAIHDDAKAAVVRVWDVKTGKPVDEVPLNRPKLDARSSNELLLVAGRRKGDGRLHGEGRPRSLGSHRQEADGLERSAETLGVRARNRRSVVFHGILAQI